MPQGWDLGVLGDGGQKFIFSEIQTKFGVQVTHMNSMFKGTILLAPAPLGLGEGPKGQISLNFNYKVNSKVF